MTLRNILPLPVPYLLEAKTRVAAKPHLVDRVRRGMAEPPTHEHHLRWDPERNVTVLLNRIDDLIGKLRGHNLVSIQMQDPLIAPLDAVERPVPLAGKCIELSRVHPRAASTSDIDSPIAAFVVNHDNVVTP
jgi:hypothetical protein